MLGTACDVVLIRHSYVLRSMEDVSLDYVISLPEGSGCAWHFSFGTEVSFSCPSLFSELSDTGPDARTPARSSSWGRPL